MFILFLVFKTCYYGKVYLLVSCDKGKHYDNLIVYDFSERFLINKGHLFFNSEIWSNAGFNF